MTSLINFVKGMTHALNESRLYKKSTRLASQIVALEANDPKRVTLIQAREAIEAERIMSNDKAKQLRESIDADQEKIRRAKRKQARHPDRFYRRESFMNKRLGALPAKVKILNPTLQQMREIESHNQLLTVVCLGLYATLVSTAAAAPWLLHGVTSLWTEPTPMIFPSEIGIVHVITIIYVFSLIVFRNQIDNQLYRSAIMDEQTWRMGSEHWTWPQRGASYFAAMLPKMYYVPFIPAIVIFIWWLPIPLLSKLYLDVYSRTGDAEYATLTAAKFNARLFKYLALVLLVGASTPGMVAIIM